MVARRFTILGGEKAGHLGRQKVNHLAFSSSFFACESLLLLRIYFAYFLLNEAALEVLGLLRPVAGFPEYPGVESRCILPLGNNEGVNCCRLRLSESPQILASSKESVRGDSVSK
jgi:hypothetical protein